MKYYIVDDEIGTVKTLENIVESRDLGEVIGYATDPEKLSERFWRCSRISSWSIFDEQNGRYRAGGTDQKSAPRPVSS